ncbi:hypothetical protein RHM65_22205 [Pseudomonas sp. CCI4.2]|uniref:hypothetical protein n=1 Tax=Pseudomonas sp. CCI4.2 TaxID=3048620 RepID=UPI002AC9DC6A|nr:hypothetical protein [Pseudomonas sp. CCI4.2]MEB0090081.1 hypothetical protein [Pseudomonas sp. CCI4.2]WPX53455.1 hypothetical protein RHM65_22205 [Pseudomonas sp. CCI4.2]
MTAPLANSWAPVTLRWPEQATQWLGGLEMAKTLAGSELVGTALRLADLDGLATTTPGPVAGAAKAAVELGRAALAGQLGQAPACLAVTPFQPGVGQGQGYQRFLSAPNLVQLLADKLLDGSGTQLLAGEQHALVILFLSTGVEQLAATLARFNAVLPVPDLVRTEKRARHLSRLEIEKWELPSAGPLPRWDALPLERCTLTKTIKQTLSGQLAVLEGYTADSSPLGDLSALAQRKAAQSAARDQQLDALKQQLANPSPDGSMLVRQLGPGNPTELRRDLLAAAAPGHEWVLCAGLMLVGPLEGLSLVQELVGL